MNYSPVTALNYSIMFWYIVWYTSYADFTDLMYVYVLLPVSVCVCISSASLSSLCSESEKSNLSKKNKNILSKFNIANVKSKKKENFMNITLLKI